MVLQHADVGDELSQAEWIAQTTHATASEAQGDLLYYDGSGWERLAADTGKVLQSNAAAAPSWVTHSAFTGSTAVHQSAYIQSTDPGAVGTGVFWLDTSASPYTLKCRNAADTGWLTITLGATSTVEGPELLTNGDLEAASGSAASTSYGINWADGWWGRESLPGTLGVDYLHPTAADWDYWQAKGLTLMRYWVLWERMQPALGGALSSTNRDEITTLISDAVAHGMQVCLCFTDGCRRYVDGVEYRVGATSTVTQAHWTDYWDRVSAVWANTSGIYGYELTNEPHDMGGSSNWFNLAQAAITAIRGNDTTHAIVVDGEFYGAPQNWVTNSDNLRSLVDPNDNLIFSAHMYWDQGQGGTYPAWTYPTSYDKVVIVDGFTTAHATSEIEPFVSWCEAYGLNGYVGEYGVPDDDSRWYGQGGIMDTFLAYLQSHDMDATVWLAGTVSSWGNYKLLVSPVDGVDAEQMDVIDDYPSSTGTGGLTGFDNWSAAGLTVSTTVHGDSYAAQLTGSAAYLYQDVGVDPSTSYRLRVWTRGDGTYGGRYQIGDRVGGTDIASATATGVTSTTYTQITIDFTTPTNCTLVRISGLGPSGTTTGYAYFDDWSLKERNYAATQSRTITATASLSLATPGGSELLLNTGFEDGTGNDADNWTQSAGAFRNVDDPRTGTYAMRCSLGDYAAQEVTVTPGATYNVSFWNRGDGTKQGRYRIYDVTNAADIIAWTATGNTSTTYAQVTNSFDAPAGCVTAEFRVSMSVAEGGTAYFDDTSFLAASSTSYGLNITASAALSASAHTRAITATASLSQTGSELLQNTGFETGSAYDASNWDQTTGAQRRDDNERSGSYGMRCYWGDSAYQNITVTAGTSYRLTFWTCRSDSLVVSGRYRVWDNTNNVAITAWTSTGVTGTTYTQVTHDFVAPTGCTSVEIRLGIGVEGQANFDDVSVTALT